MSEVMNAGFPDEGSITTRRMGCNPNRRTGVDNALVELEHPGLAIKLLDVEAESREVSGDDDCYEFHAAEYDAEPA